MIPERNPGRRRQRRWDRVSWWYSLLLVLPLLGFLATYAWSSSNETDGLSGVVRDAYTGEPISGAIISTADATVTTNKNGGFSLGDTQITEFTVSRDDYESTQVAIAGTDDDVEISLRPTSVHGTITNKSTGDPIPNVTVAATGPAGESVSATTGADGKYELKNVPQGASITVIYEGFTVVSKAIGTNARLDFEIRPDILTGRVTDEQGQPIEGATVSVGAASAVTGADGTYRIAAVPESGTIFVKKAGYFDNSGPLPESLRFDAQLTEFTVKAIYATSQTAASDELWGEIIRIAEETEVNAIVLDIKDSTGQIFYDTQVPMATEIGANQPLYDLQTRLKDMHDRGIYAIARLVVFEDPLLAEARPELAIHDVSTGGLWTTWNGLAWVNAHEREVWQYNIAIAVEAAKAGFDEIQLDYIRFPSDGLLENADYGPEFANETRLTAITGFLGEMQKALAPTGAFLAVDIFGITMFEEGDGGIGQNYAAIAPLVDIVCPMIYPSHFYPGEMGWDIPNDHPYEVILTSLESGTELVPGARDKLRPWLQDFSYGEGIEYGEAEVRAQIKATEDFGTHGWMIWSPNNVYHEGAFAPE